jgi:hypothetical protein
MNHNEKKAFLSDVTERFAEAIAKSLGDSVTPQEEANCDYTASFPILKRSPDKRIVTGIVLEPDEVDSQNDTIPASVIEKAAHSFLSGYNLSTEIAEMHTTFGVGIRLIESYVAPSDLTIGEEKVKKGSWVISVFVESDEIWEKIMKGEITGFSIGGTAWIESLSED